MKTLEEADRKNSLTNTLFDVVLFIAALAFVLTIQGAIPFLTAPTLGQAIWTAFPELERDWVHDMREVVNKGERIAFLPWRNDFLVNYLAPRLEIISYNIGGDKNLAEARRHWPKTMQLFPAEIFDTSFAERVIQLLAEGEADRVILPYVDTRWAAHQWPYPPEFKQSVSLVLTELKKNKSVEIIERDYYASVKLNCN